jgi:excisionase family DNA binding protein
MFEDTQPPAPGFMSVAEAARALGVSEARVRQLARARELGAQRVRGVWFLRVEDVERRAELAPDRGRRLTPARAWGVLCLAANLPAPWLDRAARYRLRTLLKQRGFKTLRPRLTERGALRHFRCHPSQLQALKAEQALMLTGATAATELRLGLLAHDVVEAYVAEDQASDVIGRYHLRPGDEPNAILRIVPRFTTTWPFAREAPVPAVALDLLEDPDPRTREIGQELLERLGV